jgi:hypothetical protein
MRGTTALRSPLRPVPETNETNVGRHRIFSHAAVLAIVTMLAWHWLVALPIVEGSTPTPTGGRGVTAKRPASGMIRTAIPVRATTETVLQLDSEAGEDGDDFGPLHPPPRTLLALSVPDPEAQAVRLLTAPPARPPDSPARLCRLRC